MEMEVRTSLRMDCTGLRRRPGADQYDATVVSCLVLNCFRLVKRVRELEKNHTDCAFLQATMDDAKGEKDLDAGGDEVQSLGHLCPQHTAYKVRF